MKIQRTKKIFCIFLSLLLALTLWTPISINASDSKTLPSNEVTITVGETTLLKNPVWSFNTIWESSDIAVVKVSNRGVITAVAAGTAVITATSKGFYFVKDTITEFIITVVEEDDSDIIQIKVGETVALPLPNEKGITIWKSSDTSIAKVSNAGSVTGVAEGIVTITATTKTDGVHFWFFNWGKAISTTKYRVEVTDNADIPEPEKKYYTVSFETNGGEDIEMQSVEEGGKAIKPADPKKEGFEFTGWYTDKELTIEYDFNLAVVSDIILYAKWKENNIINRYTVTFDSNGGSIIESQVVTEGELAVRPEDPVKEGYVFVGWYRDEDFESYYDFESEKVTTDIVLYAYWINIQSPEDSDNDEITDDIEHLLDLDPKTNDTDGDGLDDYLEINDLYLNPKEVDSDNNGIPDGNEDFDKDGLDNISEIGLGTDPSFDDTDNDEITDGEEVSVYKTDPLNADTDGDGLNDGKEIELGTDPLEYQSAFDISISTQEENTDLKAMVNITLDGNQVDTLEIESVNNESLFPENIPGYIGEAYNFTVDGSFDQAEISFEFDNSLLDNESFDPIIYYYNEERQELEELETIVTENIASAIVSHFSTYILIDRSIFKETFEWIDVWDDNDYTSVDVIFVVDDSGSMTSNDSSYERLSVAQDLIEKLPTDSRVGVIRFASSTPDVLTSELTEDRDLAKSYLTTNYFKSSGGTYMYTAINSGFSLFGDSANTTLKMMIVLSDGDTSDTSKHTSTVSTAVENNIKIYTVGLGTSTTYFTKYLKPLAENTGAAFYLAEDASQLSNIYEDISNKIDIETDSDSDGISDYYEDNMYIFNGCRLLMDKNNPDTDGDGLLDGQEIAVSYKYNEDGTKAIVTGKMESNPTKIDSDGDGLYDNECRVVDGVNVAPRDPAPLKYNGKKGAWNAHVSYATTDIIPTEYCDDEAGQELLEYLPQWAADTIVSLIIKLDNPLTEYNEVCKTIGTIIKGCYTISNVGFGWLNEKYSIGELDEMIGAYILNFIHDDHYIAYHSQPDTWQSKFGYNIFYDDIFEAATDMTTSNAIDFSSDGTNYAIWMWKGDYYNLHSGAEIGLYEYKGADPSTDIDLYNAISFRVPMTLNLYYYYSSRNIEHVFGWAPTEKQWWITGFNTEDKYEVPKKTPMITVGTIDFSGHENMYSALKSSVERTTRSDYFIFDEDGHTIWIMWDQI